MVGSGEKLTDILNADFWKTPSWRFEQGARTVDIANAKLELSILPIEGDRKVPLLRIDIKGSAGQPEAVMTMNCEAVDEQIGRLTKMRNLLAEMKAKANV